MYQVYDPETKTIVKITEEQHQEGLKVGKENAYKMYRDEVEKIAGANGLEFVDVVRAMQLLVNPATYEDDVRRLFEWHDAPEFMQRLFEEGKNND